MANYSLEDIKKAFWSVLHDRVVLWLPNILDESVVENIIMTAWDEFVEGLQRRRQDETNRC